MSADVQPGLGLPRSTVLLVIVPALALVGYYEWSAYSAAGGFGFPLDDAWIHAQFARNLASLRGFTYTTDQWVSGSTAPLWTLTLAAGLAIARDVVVAAKLLGVLFQLLAGVSAARLASVLGLGHEVAALVGMATAVVPVLVWGAGSGMEVPLATALVMAGLVAVVRKPDDRPPYGGYLLLGLASLARPESLVIGLVVAAFELTQPLPWRTRVGRMLLAAGIVCAVFSLVVLLSALTMGRPLPTTFYAKSGPGIMRALEVGDPAMLHRNLTVWGPTAMMNYWAILLDQLGPAAWAVPIGFITCLLAPERRRAALLVAAILLVTPYVMGVTSPQRLKPDNVRYAAQLVAPAAVFAAGAAGWLMRTSAVARVGALAVLVSIAIRAIGGAPAYAVSVKNIQELHVTAGLWMREHLPEDALVAVNDVGAIAYFSHRRILDLEGLVSPEVLPFRTQPERGLLTVQTFRPDYLAIFPAWYPDLARRTDLFTEVHRISITDNFISAGDTLLIYGTPWTRKALR